MIKLICILLLSFVDEIALRNSLREAIDAQIKAAEKQLVDVKESIENTKVVKGQPQKSRRQPDGRTIQTFPNPKARDQYIASFDEKIIKAKHVLKVAPTFIFSMVGSFRVGEVGVPDDSIEILQITEGGFHGKLHDQRCLFKGWKTDQLTDDGTVVISLPIWASGTTTYATVGGSTKTIVVLEPVPETLIAKVLREMKEEFPPKTELRTWKYEDQEFKGKAIKYTPETITVLTDDGEKELELKKMYVSDRTHVRKELGPVLDLK